MKIAQGFTLIELLLVIAIIGILAAVLLPNLLNARDRANITTAQAYGKHCLTAVEILRDGATGTLPTEKDCAVLTGQTLPSSVTSAQISYPNADSYTLKVVVNNSKASEWDYNGEKWIFTE